MGKGLDKTFPKDDTLMFNRHKKILNITNHQRNAASEPQNTASQPLGWLLLKKRKRTNIDGDVKNENPCALMVRLQNGSALMENSRWFFEKCEWNYHMI